MNNLSPKNASTLFLICWIAILAIFCLGGCCQLQVITPETDFDKVAKQPIEGMIVKVYQFTGTDNPCIGGIGACNATIGNVCFIAVAKGDMCRLRHERSHCAGWQHFWNDYSCGIRLGNS